MPTYVVDHRALGASVEHGHKEAFERVVRAVRVAVKLHGPRIFQQLVDAESRPPVDRGTYRRSTAAEDVKNGVEFYNFSPHGPVVEDGRRPGGRMPPVDKIADWVQRKKIVKRGARNRSAARAVAFVIARAIARRGQRGHHILARTERRLTPIVQRRVDDELGRGGAG